MIEPVLSIKSKIEEEEERKKEEAEALQSQNGTLNPNAPAPIANNGLPTVSNGQKR